VRLALLWRLVTCNQLVTVNDAEAPKIQCPSDVVVNNTPGQCSAAVTYPTAPTGTDNCIDFTTAHHSGPLSGSVFPVGTSPIQLSAADVTGNEGIDIVLSPVDTH
jgi:hypothetical protein